MDTLYTKSGDEGMTSLYSGQRVYKHELRLDAYGSVDEAQAFLGLARAQVSSQIIAQDLYDIEIKLMDVMAELATLDKKPRIADADVAALEARIDFYTAALDEVFRWSIPGDSCASASLHVARTQVRRAERKACMLNEKEYVNKALLAYLNRLSDLCYAMARYEDEAE